MHYASIWIPLIARKICTSDNGMVNKRSWPPQNRFASVSFILMIVMVVIFRFSFLIHDPLISGFEPYYKFPTFAFATEINCCVGHISCVQDTFL